MYMLSAPCSRDKQIHWGHFTVLSSEILNLHSGSHCVSLLVCSAFKTCTENTDSSCHVRKLFLFVATRPVLFFHHFFFFFHQDWKMPLASGLVAEGNWNTLLSNNFNIWTIIFNEMNETSNNQKLLRWWSFRNHKGLDRVSFNTA